VAGGSPTRARRHPEPGPALDRVDLKSPGGVDVLLRLVEHADGLIEGFRPGVAERLGFGPDVCLAGTRS